ncbi:MAG: hypothetical protein ABEJ91_02995 [Candidatus Nanohaloarchaea archaeon]
MDIGFEGFKDVLRDNWIFLLFLSILLLMILLTPGFFDFNRPFYFMMHSTA